MDKFWVSTRAQVFFLHVPTDKVVSQTIADFKRTITAETLRDFIRILDKLAPDTHETSHASLIQREQLELD